MDLLKSIHIKNFRSIIDQRIELAGMTSIVGANESGKTNILQAIGHIAKNRQDSKFRRRDLNLSLRLDPNSEIELEFEVEINNSLIPTLSSEFPNLNGSNICLRKVGKIEGIPKWTGRIKHVPFSGRVIIVNKVNTFRKELKEHGIDGNKIALWADRKWMISGGSVNLTAKPFYSLKNNGAISVLPDSEKSEWLTEQIKEDILAKISLYTWEYNKSRFLQEMIPLEDFCKHPQKYASVKGIFSIARDSGAFTWTVNAPNLQRYILNGDETDQANLLAETQKHFNRIFAKAWKSYWGHALELRIGHQGDNLTFRFFDGRDTPPEYRSDGLKWFVTFLINFQSLERTLSNYILLMDEPGGYLHPKGQKDALRLLLKLSKKNQIIYSTHQTFLIDKNMPENVRILDRSKKNRRLGIWPTIVHSIKNENEHILRDSLLRESLGFKLSDISPINEYNILLEGVFDRYVFQYVNDKKKILDMNVCSFISCGKASNILKHAELYSQNDLDVICIYDNDPAGMSAYDRNTVVDASKRILISTRVGETIEDILPDYIFKDALAKVVSSEKEQLTNIDDFKKPYIQKVFNQSVKNVGKDERAQFKSDLEEEMKAIISKNPNEEYTRVNEILKECKILFKILAP